jgi:hypothetical protein
MLALSLNQPYASLVGKGKAIETRSWPKSEKQRSSLVGQTLAIHATKNFPEENRISCYVQDFFLALWPNLLLVTEKIQKLEESEFKDGVKRAFTRELTKRINMLPSGVIIATARIVEFRSTNDTKFVNSLSEQEKAFGNYDPNRWMWILSDIKRLDTPIPAKGKQGLWTWEEGTTNG